MLRARHGERQGRHVDYGEDPARLMLESSTAPLPVQDNERQEAGDERQVGNDPARKIHLADDRHCRCPDEKFQRSRLDKLRGGNSVKR